MKLLRISFALVCVSLTAACGLVRKGNVSAENLKVTQAYQTVAARITQSWGLTPSPLLESTTAPVPQVSPTSTPTGSVVRSPQPTQPTQTLPPGDSSGCNRAAPGLPAIDITIDDYTEMIPGQGFTKIWRLANAGDCTWTKDYEVVYFFGEKMGDTLSVSLSESVFPGGSVDIAVDMVAPFTPGDYRSNWMISDDKGDLFGIGPNGDLPFWVQIVVIPPDTPTGTTTSIPTNTGTPTVIPSATPTPTTTPRVLASGPASMDPSSSIDLDTNTVNPNSGSDLAYQQDAASAYWLIPQEPALLGFWGTTEPGLADCLTAAKSAAPIALGSLTPGTYLCYQTDNGHPGWLRYVSFDGTNARLEITILTWDVH